MIYIFDGAMGTMLQQAGLPPGYCPELWNIENPAAVTAIHRQYVESGSHIIETNTFGANRIKLAHYNMQTKVGLLNSAAVKAARAAAGPETKIAGSVGPTGKLISPLGDLSFDEAFNVFHEQIAALDEGGVDYIIIETIIDIQEMRAALLAAKEATRKPVICQLTFEQDGRTVTGTDPRTAAIILEKLGAAVIGANCSLGPAQLTGTVAALAAATRLPVIVQPNAGMPRLENGRTVFPMDPEEFAAWGPKLIQAGASYIGGCCGTTPSHIKALRASLESSVSGAGTNPPSARYTALASRTKTVYLGAGFPTAIIGERINPTGKKALAADIRGGQFLAVKKEALSQVKAGAAILDVNMGVPGIDQAAAMKKAVDELSMLVDVPLSIDTTDPKALEAGLKAFPGRALVNSVSAEPERVETFLPLAKKYGAAVLCLPIGAGGVPKTAEDRTKVAQEIIAAAFSAGLEENDLLLDPLVLTVAAEADAALETLRTLKMYRERFGYPTVMGLSNVSYGLPKRELMNGVFCSMALAVGLDAPILNPHDQSLQDVLKTSSALLGFDQNGRNYSLAFGQPQISEHKQEPAQDILSQICQCVINGEKEAVVPLITAALESGCKPMEITDKALTKAMNFVGDAFGAGRCYLPQVMLSAETMRAAFNTLKAAIPSHETATEGTVVLATVKGDIHDLGKNIVAALLENNGFKVVDLGKDVAPETVVREANRHQADLVGLCALMTTTMPQIDITIKALQESGCKAKFIVGGAVLTADYAAKAGAHAYAPNGVEVVKIAKQFLREASLR